MPSAIEYPDAQTMAATGLKATRSSLGPRGGGPAAEPAPTPQAPPTRQIGHGYFGTTPHAVRESSPTTPATSAPTKPPASSFGSTVAMSKSAMAGFADELVKEAGLRDVLQRVFSGKGGAGRKLGFFERRRIARSLGIRPREVEHTLEQRKRVGQVARSGALAGAAALGGLAGTRLSKENADE